MVKLRERGARDHIADLRRRGIGAQAAAGAGEAHPDSSPGTFDRAGESAVVDDLAADCGEAADAFQSGTAQEQAATRRAGSLLASAENPARRIEHQEEVEE